MFRVRVSRNESAELGFRGLMMLTLQEQIDFGDLPVGPNWAQVENIMIE